jgi:hypothetical protein
VAICTVGGFSFILFGILKGFKTENDNYWQNNKFLVFANCLKMYRIFEHMNLIFAKRREDFFAYSTRTVHVQYKIDEERFILAAKLFFLNLQCPDQ